MLITFTTEHGHLVIRGEDLRRIEDGAEGCIAGWVEHNTVYHSPIHGTAAENTARIVQQEAEVIAAYEEAQRLAQQKERLAELMQQTKARTTAKRGTR